MNIGYEVEAVYKKEITRLNNQINSYKEIFDSIIEPHIMVNEELSFIYVNAAACSLFQLSREELYTLKITDFLQVSRLVDFGLQEEINQLNIPYKEKKEVQLFSGAQKEIEFIRIGALSEGQRIFRLEDVSGTTTTIQNEMMSWQMFLDVFDTAQEGIVLFDSQGIILDVNEAFIDVLGISKSKLIGKNMSEVISREYKSYWEKGIQKFPPKKNSMGEIEVLVNGEYQRFTFSTSTTVRDKLFISVFRCTNDSNIIEKKLETSERIFAELFDQSMDAIIFWDEKGNIFRVNYSACKIFESSKEEMIGQNIWQYIHKKNNYFKRMLAIFERDGQVRDELFYKMPNNQIKLLELTAKKHEGDGYNVTIFRNVTERWEIEKELRKSEKKFRKIFEGSLDGLILWNQDGFADINESGKGILEISKEKLLSNSVKGFLEKIPENAADLQAHMESVEKKGVHSSVIPIKFEEGRVKHIELLTRGNMYSNLHLTVFRDVSKNLEMQEQIRKSDTLHVVGELAAGIAHEIRNPMTALKGFIQLLEDLVKEDFTTYFHIITSEIQRIETIITEFLVLAKPQALHYLEQDVQIILKETLELLAAQALLDNIRFETSFEESEVNIFCEAKQLKQVFINIIKNALEVMPGGGTIRIKSSMISEKYVCISIIDQGDGISADKLKKLGEPFYTTKERGTGLGLMVSYKIIEEHNGYIEVESEVDKGTGFHIYLPLEKNNA